MWKNVVVDTNAGFIMIQTGTVECTVGSTRGHPLFLTA